MEIVLIFVGLAVVIGIILRKGVGSKAPFVIELAEVERSPEQKERDRLDAQYKTEKARERASLRRWRASLIPLKIGMLAGWTLLIDHRTRHPTPKFRPVKLKSIRYDQGSGLYLVGQCLKRNEQRHFGMDSIFGYADASTKKEFATFEEWAAHQGISVNLKEQTDAIDQKALEVLWAEEAAEDDYLNEAIPGQEGGAPPQGG